MIAAAFRYIFERISRKAFVHQIYKELFAIEIEREFFRIQNSYFINDVFQDQIDVLMEFLGPDERQHYHVVYKPRATRKFFEKVQNDLPEFVRERLIHRDKMWIYYDLRELVSLFARNRKCHAALKDIICKL